MTLNDIKGRCRLQDGHWLWSGAKSGGWPRIWAPEHTLHGGELKCQTGRRAVWHVNTGTAIPTGWRVFGTCQERDCINPDHMECVPAAQKGAQVAQSGALKGQVLRIKANRATGRKRAKLTPELIAEIQQSDESGKEWSKRTGLNQTTISRARNHKMLAFQPVGGLFSGLLAGNDSGRRAA